MSSMMTWTLGVMILSGALAACQSQRQESRSPEPAYVCHRSSDPITVDGRLDEPAWRRAEIISRFYVFSPAAAGDPKPTRVRLLWDEDYLYVGFECEDDDIWSYSSEPDGELWHGDVVEFFVKPDTRRLPYAELVVSPNGTLFDAWHASRGGGGFRRYRAWSSGATVASTVVGTDGHWEDRDESYCVEMAIPLRALAGGPDPTDTGGDVEGWTFGVFRYDYSKSREEPLLLMSMPESLKRGFHYYEGYRELRLVGDQDSGHDSSGNAALLRP